MKAYLTIQDSNESVDLQSLLTWQQFTIDFFKSIINNGMWQSLLDRLLRFKQAKDIRKKFLEVVNVDIWPLSSSSQFDVIHRISVIQSFMNQITKLGARHTLVISERVGEYLSVHPEQASRWTLYFISGGGCLYKCGTEWVHSTTQDRYERKEKPKFDIERHRL